MERFWRPALINSVLPVILVYALAMFVFATDEADVTTRLEIIVTLFLALTGEALAHVAAVIAASGGSKGGSMWRPKRA